MRPGTPHFVVTTESCLAVGGHFYCPSTMRATALAMINEHFFGPWITNSEHQKAPIILLKTLQNYLDMSRMWHRNHIVWIANILAIDSGKKVVIDKELCWLTIIIIYLDILDPLRVTLRKGYVHAKEPWRDMPAFRHDFLRAHDAAVELFEDRSYWTLSMLEDAENEFVSYMNRCVTSQKKTSSTGSIKSRFFAAKLMEDQQFGVMDMDTDHESEERETEMEEGLDEMDCA